MTHVDDKTSEKETRLETHLQTRLVDAFVNLGCRVETTRSSFTAVARTYHAKQLAKLSQSWTGWRSGRRD